MQIKREGSQRMLIQHKSEGWVSLVVFTIILGIVLLLLIDLRIAVIYWSAMVLTPIYIRVVKKWEKIVIDRDESIVTVRKLLLGIIPRVYRTQFLEIKAIDIGPITKFWERPVKVQWRAFLSAGNKKVTIDQSEHKEYATVTARKIKEFINFKQLKPTQEQSKEWEREKEEERNKQEKEKEEALAGIKRRFEREAKERER